MPTMIDIFYQEKWNPSELHEQSHTPAPETTPQFPQNSYHASSSIAQLLATHLASLQSNRANSTTNFQTTHSFPTSNGLQNFAPSQGISLAGLTNAGVETSVTQTLLRNMNIPLHNITTQNTVTTSANKVQMSTQQLLMNGSPIYTQSKTTVSA